MSEPVTTRLHCGAALIVEPMSGVRSVGLTWLIPAGSCREPESRQGLSAMWSELLLRGAGDLDSRAHADALDTLGAGVSASAGAWHQRITATLLGAKLDAALPLIADMVLSPRFADDAIEPVRDLCLQSLESLKDDPQERVSLLLRERHEQPPFNRSGMGTPEGLAAITRDDVVSRWRAVARPEGACIAIAGAVDPRAVEARLNELLKGWTGEPTPIPAPAAPAPRAYHHTTEETNQVHIALCFDAPREADEDAMAERVVNAALSGGMSGRLFTEVREKRGLCYSVHASYRADRDYGRVTAYSGTTPERAQETLDVMWRELERIGAADAPRKTPGGAQRRGGKDDVKPGTPDGRLDDGEFQRAVVGMKSRTVMSGESTSARAAALATDWHKLGRPRSLERFLAQVNAVTLDTVNAYLRRRPLGRPTCVTLGPAPLTPPF